MERLTKWTEIYGWVENNDNRKWEKGSRACMEKLAAYEDTGFTPVEFEKIICLLKRAVDIMRFHSARCDIDPLYNYSGSEEHCAEYREVIREAKAALAGKEADQ